MLKYESPLRVGLPEKSHLLALFIHILQSHLSSRNVLNLNSRIILLFILVFSYIICTRNRCLRCIQPASKIDAEACALHCAACSIKRALDRKLSPTKLFASSRCFISYKIVPNGPKWSQMVPNGPKWSQMVPMVPNGSYGYIWVYLGIKMPLELIFGRG